MAEFKKKATDKMEGQVEHLRHEFTGLRTGRASVALLDQVKVEYYGTPTPLRDLATINAPEPRLLIIHAYDKGSIASIEKAIQSSQRISSEIRSPLPPLDL